MRIVDLLIALATVLQVKDTGKSRERVKPVELGHAAGGCLWICSEKQVSK